MLPINLAISVVGNFSHENLPLMIAGLNPQAEIGFTAIGDRHIHTDEILDAELDFEADLRAQDAWRESQLMQETGGLGSMAKGIMRPGGRHTIVCKHWLRDLCMKGDKCDFLHQYDLARMPECTQWSRMGRCIDQECDFRHDTERIECQKFKFGFCKLGGQCKMRHERHMRPYLPEVIPDWYLKELVPNIFEYVPKLPEEAVRITNLDEQLFGSHPPFPPPHQDAGSWNVGHEGTLPAVSQDAWAVPAAPQWSTQAFRDVQPAARERRRVDAVQRVSRDERRGGARKAPVTEVNDLESRPQSPGRDFKRPFAQDRHRGDEKKMEYKRDDRKPSPNIEDRQRERRYEPRREERRSSPPAARREQRRHSPINDRERRFDRRDSPPRGSGRLRENQVTDRQASTRGSSPSSRRTDHRDRRDDQRDDRRRHRSRSRSVDRRRNDRHRENRR